MIRVAVAEDNPKLAEAIRENLECFEGIELLFIASNGQDLIDKLSEKSCDLVLMDINMPVMDGITATSEVRRKFPSIKVIMLTVFDDGDNIFNSILAGATGYVLKDEKPARLLAAIEDAMEGGAPMSPAIAQKTLQFVRGQKPEPARPETDFNLSRREIEILEQMAQGLNYNEIADKLFISPKTVRKHFENIYQKLHAHNKIEAISIARRNKLIP